MTYQIPFNKPFQTGKELVYIQDAIQRGKISGNGYYTQKCQEFFEERYGFLKCLLTTSCTDALEMAAILLDIQPGDEVILPSFTFVSTANAFVLRGAKCVFVDSRTDHPGMDESLVEELITPKTKAIVAVHYAGYPVEMDKIIDLAHQYGLKVVEDAAQAIDQEYQGKYLGAWGHLATFSFHETKNIQCGEGGMLVINELEYIKRAEIIWEKGTDRAAFFRGEVNKYGWVDMGSSFLPSELQAAFLWAQLENLQDIQAKRQAIWQDYQGFFSDDARQPTVLSEKYLKKFTTGIEEAQLTGNYQVCKKDSSPNAHLFYLIFEQLSHRTVFINQMKTAGIFTVFHYQSLHRSDFIQKYQGIDARELPHADRYSDCLLRLPLFYELS
ncbi:dTDP-4-amino-4,6-dideoxygalactose transaminase [Algoriphagus algorifonticola]|uniref:dTDP-4-amino-4,6-dideoxygalactose transaminase n=1 Tax=Algoriphagus algorifonticola TaxID=2593007 RepID=UPI0011A5BE05|nr:dTDP-4-amino-4,6-dideoxygalactose transaminase [Algoriphagus algorifonticola]